MSRLRLLLQGLRKPSSAKALGRASARTALDFAFDWRSPIEPLSSQLQHKIGSHAVLLPPQRLFTPANQAIQGLVFLVSIAIAINARNVFEIGTYNGLTALALAENLPSATVHTLDLPPGDRPSLPLFPTDRRHLDLGRRRVYDASPVAERIIQHFGDSASFDFAPFAGKIDLVYVDGAHSFEYVESDSRAALMMRSERSAIVWDDYWRQIPDVPRFLEGLSGRDLFRIPQTRLVVELSAGARALLT